MVAFAGALPENLRREPTDGAREGREGGGVRELVAGPARQPSEVGIVQHQAEGSGYSSWSCKAIWPASWVSPRDNHPHVPLPFSIGGIIGGESGIPHISSVLP